MTNNNHNNSQYIEGNLRVRVAVFVFLGLWVLMGFILKPIAENRLEEIRTVMQSPPTVVLNEILRVIVTYVIIPNALFFSIQGIYLMWLGIKTIQTGTHPPSGVRMPFRTKLRIGRGAKVTALGYFIASICQFAAIVAAIVFTMLMRNSILKNI